MERREQYDPEDIESLLSERGFDELLAEERAFVLRHISDREEYERMRAMLHFMRPDEGSRTTIEADEAVRTNVLAAFKAQQQPQWRIWLNSISALFIPQEGFAMWRPALALASLALLIVVGVFTVKQFEANNGNSELAEVRKVPSEPSSPARAETGESGPVEDQAVDQKLDDERLSVPPLVPGSNEDFSTSGTSTVQAATAEKSEFRSATDAIGSQSKGSDVPSPSFDMADVVSAPKREEKASEENIARVDNEVTQQATPTQSRVVTMDELAQNQSLANATGAVRSKDLKKRAVALESAEERSLLSRNMAEDPALIGLIEQGW